MKSLAEELIKQINPSAKIIADNKRLRPTKSEVFDYMVQIRRSKKIQIERYSILYLKVLKKQSNGSKTEKI